MTSRQAQSAVAVGVALVLIAAIFWVAFTVARDFGERHFAPAEPAGFLAPVAAPTEREC